MAVPLILCRLKDDHSIVHEIGETALVYFPDWEPVPVEQRELIEARNSRTDPPEEPGEGSETKVTEHKPRARTRAAGSAVKDKE